MTKKQWKAKIKKATEEAGTYRPFFDSVIDTLADILEARDNAKKHFEDSGADSVVEHTNKGGNTNLAQHPALRLVNDLNRDALAYWRELGLTPAGLKKINEDAMKKVEKDALAEALKSLGG